MAKHKDNILRLRAEGKSYREIEKELGCAKSTIAYHLGDGQKEKTRERRKNISDQGLRKKIDSWKNGRPASLKKLQQTAKSQNWRFRTKVRKFQMKNNGDTAPVLDWTYDEVKEMIKDYTSCYLTGRPVDINDCSTYHFDHIEPRSAGGSNDLDNLGVATPQANYAKRDMPLEDFLALCLDVVIHWDLVDEDDVKL